MRNNHTSRQEPAPSKARRRALAMCVLGMALLAAPGAAQVSIEPTVIVLKSGLHTVFEGHDFVATLVEVGSRTSFSRVTIEFRDASDQRRAFTAATVDRAHPLRLRFRLPVGAGRDQLRAIVTITSLTNAGQSEPVAGLEDVDADSLTVVPKVVCGGVNPSVGSGAEGNCDGWGVSRLTLQQADAQD